MQSGPDVKTEAQHAVSSDSDYSNSGECSLDLIEIKETSFFLFKKKRYCMSWEIKTVFFSFNKTLPSKLMNNLTCTFFCSDRF